MRSSAQLLPQTQSSIPAHWKVPHTLSVSSPSVGKLFWKPSQTCQETYLYGDSKSSQVGNGDQPSKHSR